MYTATIKKILQIFIVKCVLSSILISNSANAAIIYDQPGSTLPGLNSDNRGIYDDFQLASNFILTRYEWTGGTVSFASPPGDAPPSLFGGIAEDASGQPDGPVVDIFNIVVNPPTAVFLGSTSSGGITSNVYRYSVDLTSPITLQGGQRYWLGINGSFSHLQLILR
ncbi:hypothetical protein SAMN05216402_1742 [Nitrosospira multiformis]|uniref:Uncharacterized protein n=1 Tax=Nitrosospira multiformis TaxID=1231 RepID=A0ABY0TDC9_9PROT|nr:hypothetical protein SAMN05216402_1742 [Nitrosospira multiformis]